MKVLDIALKDMLRYFRSSLAIGFMLVMPLLITGLIAAAFGEVLTSSETGAYTLPVIRLQVVNLDPGDAEANINGGQFLIDALTDEAVKNVFEVTLAADEAAARTAVDRQEAALALIIPANFTQALLANQQAAAVSIYEDPTLSFGPGITREIVNQFLDALSGSRIVNQVTADQLAAQGLSLDPAAATELQAQYAAWFRDTAADKSWNLPLTKRLPNRETAKTIADHRTTLLGPVMAGMLIFFVFFTGTNTAQSILREQEEGTLARMFTTPTPIATILGGKFAAVLLTLVVQSIVLLAASALVFQINWGNLLTLALVVFGLVISGTGFGVFLMSFIKNTKQAGSVSGGVLAVAGMLGGLFSTGVQNVPPVMESLSVTMPQGWALRGMKLALAGAAPQDALLPVLMLLAFGVVFFVAGVRFFSKRFA